MRDEQIGLLLVGAALAGIWLIRRREAEAGMPDRGGMPVLPEEPSVLRVTYPTPKLIEPEDGRLIMNVPVSDLFEWIGGWPVQGEPTLPAGGPTYYQGMEIGTPSVEELLATTSRPITAAGLEQPTMTSIRG